MGKELRLVIAIPSGTEWKADFGMSMCLLMAKLSQKVKGFDSQMIRVHNKKTSILAASRQELVAEAIKNSATHVLFIDSDQTFPATIVHRLLQHGKQIVACNVATKRLPSTPTARLKGGKVLYTRPDSTGLVEVWRIGTGIMLIDLNLFKRKGMETPYFSQRWDEEEQVYIGEDWAFCEKLEAAGVKLYVDQGLSREIGHVGSLCYGHDMVEVKSDSFSDAA